MRATALTTLGMLLVLGLPAPGHAGCGCDKPPPAHAAVRPFAGYTDQIVTIFDDRLVPGWRYAVQFESTIDGTTDWSQGKAIVARDLADAEPRVQVKFRVPKVSIGPCRLIVWGSEPLFTIEDDAFTVAARPVALYDFDATFVRTGYRAAVGRDGTLYIPVNVKEVDDATTFHATASGLDLRFRPRDVSIFNEQGFVMTELDPSAGRRKGIDADPVVKDRNAEANADAPPALAMGSLAPSSVLTYWRHEFVTYKDTHRKAEGVDTDDDVNWHNDGTAHVDHDHLLIAIRGRRADGGRLVPGTTAPFDLILTSVADTPADAAPPVEEGESQPIANDAPPVEDGGSKPVANDAPADPQVAPRSSLPSDSTN